VTHKRRLEVLADGIAAWSAAQPGVRACFWFGGFSRGIVDDRSDLDVAFVMASTVDARQLHVDILRALGVLLETVEWSTHLARERRIVLWLAPDLLRLELHYAHDPAELSWLVDALDVPAPRVVAAWPPKDRTLDELIERAALAIHPNDAGLRRERAEEEVDKFVVAFEACSSAHARSDAYSFYFQYNLALGRLVRILQLARVGYDHLYLPRNLLAGSLSLPEQLEMRALAGSLYLPEATRLKDQLAQRFVSGVIEARAKLGIERDAEQLRGLLERIRRRDVFFNVRDVARSFPGRVQPGRWLRASALSRWSRTSELREWLTHAGVSDIVDLRTPAETARMPYSPEDLKGIQHHGLPIVGPGSVEPDGHFFELLGQHSAQVQSVVRVLLRAEGSVVVHCHAGKDRTGWLCAMLQAAMHLPDAHIEEDYLASKMDTRGAFICSLLAALEARGGAGRVLLGLGVSPDEITALGDRFLIGGVAHA
jgi:hypothetical protein